jgi:tripeptidyl-peptidase-1
MAVAEFQAQHYSYTDINAFTDACQLPRVTVIDKYGGNKPSVCDAGACVEALLDIEYIYGVGGPIPLADYWLATYSLLDWINGVLADPAPSLVHSVSYGNDEVQQTSTSYMFQCNTQFQAAGVKGLTIMFASGDQGVWGRTGRGTTFHPDFPAASPYITAVGGSDLSTNSIGPETCCTDSGGGFSNTFARPSYQNTAVTGYLANPSANLPPSSYYNASSRAYPDISAIFGLAIPYCVHSGGRFEGVAGTSASCPVVAAQIANLNNVQLLAGKAPLGFINPWLYQTLAAAPGSFNDIKTGINNQGAGYGFTAIAGWDPCTGVGSPIYSNMVKQLP